MKFLFELDCFRFAKDHAPRLTGGLLNRNEVYLNMPLSRAIN